MHNDLRLLDFENISVACYTIILNFNNIFEYLSRIIIYKYYKNIIKSCESSFNKN